VTLGILSVTLAGVSALLPGTASAFNRNEAPRRSAVTPERAVVRYAAGVVLHR
jgi:hypothetical protein